MLFKIYTSLNEKHTSVYYGLITFVNTVHYEILFMDSTMLKMTYIMYKINPLVSNDMQILA